MIERFPCDGRCAWSNHSTHFQAISCLYPVLMERTRHSSIAYLAMHDSPARILTLCILSAFTLDPSEVHVVLEKDVSCSGQSA